MKLFVNGCNSILRAQIKAIVNYLNVFALLKCFWELKKKNKNKFHVLIFQNVYKCMYVCVCVFAATVI